MSKAIEVPTLELIHPISDEFHVYGGDDVVDRAQEWAIYNQYLLVGSLPMCAHGFYMMHCPTGGGRCLDIGDTQWYDHMNMWVDAGWRRGRLGPTPFLLSATYSDAAESRSEAKVYADAHALRVAPGSHTETCDNWYGGNTTPIRLDLSDSFVVWPIEFELSTLLSSSPVTWPDDEH